LPDVGVGFAGRLVVAEHGLAITRAALNRLEWWRWQPIGGDVRTGSMHHVDLRFDFIG